MSAREVLERWSRETIQHAACTGVNDYGERLYAAAVPRLVRIDHTSKIVRSLQGEEVVSGTQLYIATTDAIGVQDQITLPDGSTPLILQVDRLADHNGIKWMVTIFLR